MDPKMYKAAKFGNVSILKSTTNIDLTNFLTPQRNTILHIAARFQQIEFVAEVLNMQPQLLLQANSKGDTALHITARSGDLRLVKLVVGCTDIEASDSILRKCNLVGNTALHEAIGNKNNVVALELLKDDPGLAMCVNNAIESPLYLAADYGLFNVAEEILKLESVSFQGPDGQSPLHAAARQGQTEIARLLCKKVASIVGQIDENGRTALHYSARISAAKISAMLLKADFSLAYISDKDGLTPLLVAVSSNHWSMVKLILEYCPDCGELRNSNGQNALHLVMRKSLPTLEVVRHPDLEDLLNEGDNDGNTPLHLAFKTEYDKGIRSLLGRKDVNVRARNKEGDTALDLSEKSWRLISIERCLNMRKLFRHGAVRGGNKLGLEPAIPLEHTLDKLKQMANTLLVVTTLICSIAFTAAFTLPGGYSEDPSDIGFAVHGKSASFQAFLYFDFVTFFSSAICIYFLARGMTGNAYLRSSLYYSVNLLRIALFASLATFSIGIYVVLEKKCKWLAILIVLVGFTIPLLLICYTDDFLTKDLIRSSPKENSNNINSSSQQ